jgi:hypothetical protein
MLSRTLVELAARLSGEDYVLVTGVTLSVEAVPGGPVVDYTLTDNGDLFRPIYVDGKAFFSVDEAIDYLTAK